MANKEALTSDCEKEFVLNLVNQKNRLDGRDHYNGRILTVLFGLDEGCCLAVLGNTRVMAQVSCEIAIPKLARPSEGLFNINLELSPMACPQFDGGRSTDLAVEASRLIERCIRESRCIDLESLCIVSKEKVWSIRVDVHVLNHDGNIIECASVAAVAALCHFRRPHVSVIGTDVTVHSFEDHDPVPLTINHMPFCISFAIFEQGKHILVDPTDLEERVSDGKIVIAMNSLREICLLHMNGLLVLTKEKILQCTNIAATKAQDITKFVQEALDDDKKRRSNNENVGFAEFLRSNTILGTHFEPPLLKFQIKEDEDVTTESKPPNEDEVMVYLKKPGIASLGEGRESSWGILHSEDSHEEDENIEDISVHSIPKAHKKNEEKLMSGDSEEEEDMLQPKEIQEMEDSSDEEVDLTKAIKTSETRGWYPKDSF